MMEMGGLCTLVYNKVDVRAEKVKVLLLDMLKNFRFNVFFTQHI